MSFHESACAEYSNSSLGIALRSALDELAVDGLITLQLRNKVMRELDRLTAVRLAKDVKFRTTATGHLHAYNDVEGQWKLVVKNLSFKPDDADYMIVDRIKITAYKSPQTTGEEAFKTHVHSKQTNPRSGRP